MRHALIRFLTALDVDVAWSVVSFLADFVADPHDLFGSQVRAKPIYERLPHNQKQPQYLARRCTSGVEVNAGE
jgi:hypothetical protein